jgi:fermentation-respiration switch protein FrsA (DUF1100 family)
MWLLFLVALYAGIVLVMWFFENSMVYPRATAADDWQPPPDPRVEDVTFPSADGNTIHGWYLARPGSTEALLICHGNAGNLSHRGGGFLRFHELTGRNVLIFDYPGYGRSTGKPSEEGCYASADAALNWLRDAQGIPSENVAVFGDSLGGGVAVEAARRRPCQALILTKTFTTLPGVAAKKFRWLPVRWLMRNKFDSLAKIRDLHIPVLIAGATLDDLVPFSMSQELFDAAPGPKEFFPLEGEGHNARLGEPFLEAMRRFLRQHSPADAPAV